MPERKHNLPTAYDRLDDEIVGSVIDSIVIHARSRGILSMPGEYSTSNRPPAHQVKFGGTGGEQGIYKDQIQRGGPDHYILSYDVWNYRDSPSFAHIVRTAEAGSPTAPVSAMRDDQF